MSGARGGGLDDINVQRVLQSFGVGPVEARTSQIQFARDIAARWNAHADLLAFVKKAARPDACINDMGAMAVEAALLLARIQGGGAQ